MQDGSRAFQIFDNLEDAERKAEPEIEAIVQEDSVDQLPEYLRLLGEQEAVRISIETEQHWEEDRYDLMEDGPYRP